MAAIIDIYTGTRISSSPSRPDPKEHAGATLRVIPGGRSPEVIRMRRVFLFRRCLVGLILLAVAAAIAALVMGLAGGVGSSTSPKVELSEQYVVHEGDTLWGVARSIAPDSDPRDVIDEIAAVNTADGVPFDANRPLTPGQRLLVPVAG